MVFTVDEANIINNTANVAISDSTTFTWVLKKKSDGSVVSVADVDNNKTLTVKAAELIAKEYTMTVTIASPEIIVNNFDFELSDCDATTTF